MLALHRTRLRPQTLTLFYSRPLIISNRRFYIQDACNGFLDLALAIPIPPNFPAYSTTIIIVTLLSRLAFVPISIWGKRRVRRTEEIVLPEIESLKPVIAKRVFEEMKAAGVRGNKQDLQKIHAERTVEILTAKRKELFKQYKCSPLPSILAPPLSQLPFFVGFTIILNRLSQDPTPFDSESFLTLTSLAHPDPTMTLPVILGFLTMGNVESGNWVMNAAERQQQRAAEAEEARRIAAGGKVRLQPGKIIKTSLRVLSIIRIIVAALTPGSVTLYWTTSAAFGLLQTWTMEWLDARRRRQLSFTQAVREPGLSASTTGGISQLKHSAKR